MAQRFECLIALFIFLIPIMQIWYIPKKRRESRIGVASMYIEYLEELRQFSHSMNISKTAKDLHISQPSLTRHIQKMEEELGFPLVSRDKQIKLTPAGRYFVGGISQILSSYETLVDQCRQVSREGMKELVLQEPPLRSDQASARMYQIADELRSEHALLSIHFTRLGRSGLKEMLDKRTINLALVYEYGPIQETIVRYEKQGYLIRHLATESAIVWCNKSNPLAQKATLHVEDLKKYPVMLPSTPYDPLRNAWVDMCHAHGFEMRCFEYQTNVYSDYLFAEIADEVYLLLESMAEQTRLTSRLHRVFVPFAEGEANIESYLIMPQPTNAAEEVLRTIFENTAE